ncbi:TNF receptor-associated factor 3 [Stomoxys calcitrans]|uniref:TNF receptor-associated factor 3 n=1 Tax=Stomoxys calcitrans TaxID=35570 RepID=UPI0027E36820|nr:TNF receptor-associated factor 3 [Stomoxys calcitrans]
MNGTSINNGDSATPPSSPGSTTVVKYEKSSCLFCNEWFDSQTFTEHLIHCGQVLEQCPNTCNVFVPRIRMRAHLKECPRNKRRSTSLERVDHQIDTRVQVLENEINTLRSVLNEEIRQRLHLITDVGNLRKQNQIIDDWQHSTNQNVKALQLRLDEENNQRTFEVEQCQQDFRCSFDTIQALKTEIRHEIDDLEKHINQMSLDLTQHQNHLNDNIMKLEETVLLHEKINRDKFIEVENFLQAINVDLNTKLSSGNDGGKYAALDVEVKSMKHMVCETEERCDKLETLVGQIDRSLHHTMQLVNDCENHIATQQRLTSYINCRGHLVWRIKNFSKKLEEARQYDTILHSAMFSNKPFGYALRLDIYLNGKGTWKGRNMIACLNVIAGEYDPLLPWPCRLQADVIIRDQTLNQLEPDDYVKTVLVRKKSDDYIQTKQFFHISHSILTQSRYVKNDSIFVEVKIVK